MIQQSLTKFSSLKPFYELAERCRAVDGYPVKLYWNLLEGRRHDPQALDYVYFAENNPTKPVGLLSVYYFQDAVEITAMVDPDYRNRGIFNQLLENAFKVLRLYYVKSYMLICHAKAHDLNTKCAMKGGVLHHSEIEMQGPRSLTCTSQQIITLQRGKPVDLDILIEIHQACFPGSLASIKERLNLMLSEPNRQTWLAKNAEGKWVGKLHMREDETAIFLHDLGVTPAFQRQGYAKSLLYAWYQQYTFPTNKPILVDVLGDNEAALKLYLACGFTVTSHYNFWEFKLSSGFRL